MQAKFSHDKLKEQVERVMIKGLRRCAGLNLLSFAIQLNLNSETFLDLLQWFLTSLRENKHQVAHYSDEISGCGDSVLSAIRTEFFKIIKIVIAKIKQSRETETLIQLLNALIWNYKGIDMSYLAEFDLIGTLQSGDGDKTHPIWLSWGKQIKTVLQS